MIRDQHKLQQATQVKDEFLAVVSHELRTPLTSIIGYLKIIKMQCVEHMSDEQKDYFAVILRNADTLLTHINTLLDFSKIDQHTSRPKLRILRAFFEVENALKTIGVEAVSGKHPITIDPESQSMDIPIHADPKMLEQVLVNLITNSLRYSPPEKPVEVGSRKETWAGRDGVLLWVKNEGECIPDGLKERIFDKFYQAETHLTRQSHGLGLGLAIVKSIMQLHEGSAWVENLEPTGTRFCVFFPYQDDLEKG
jgi:signal transduction histidine kinase